MHGKRLQTVEGVERMEEMSNVLNQSLTKLTKLNLTLVYVSVTQLSLFFIS